MQLPSFRGNVWPVGPVALNWDSPLAPGLIGAFLNPNGVNLANKVPGLVNGTIRTTGDLLGGHVHSFGAGELSSPDNTGELYVPANAPRTISVWARPSSVAANVGIVSGASTYNSGTPRWLISCEASTSWKVYLNFEHARSTTAPAVGRADHIVSTYDGWNRLIYINGVLERSTTGNDSANANTRLWWGSGYNGYFSGTSWGLCIWNRCLSAAEVWYLYAPETRRDLCAPR